MPAGQRSFAALRGVQTYSLTIVARLSVHRESEVLFVVRQFLTLMLTLMLVLFVIAGCGGGTGPATPTETYPAPQTMPGTDEYPAPLVFPTPEGYPEP